jgi:hypothetical protein
MIKIKNSVIILVMPSVILSLLLMPLSATAIAYTNSSAYDSNTDGLVTNFEEYQSFGGQYGQAVPQITYDVYLPPAFGFNLNDTIEMLVSGGIDSGTQVVYQSNSGSNQGSCVTANGGGYNCVTVWNLTAPGYPALTQGEYTISFSALNDQTEQINPIYMDILGGTNTTSYLTSGSIFLNLPLTTPSATFTADAQSLYTLVNPQSPSSLTFTAQVNTKNSPSSVDFYLNGVLEDSDTEGSTISNSSYVGGQVAQFSYTLNNLSSLTNGAYTVTAVANGSGYSVPVLTADGQSQINIVAAYTADQSCSTQVTSINKITTGVIKQETSELIRIQTIDDQAIKYFTTHHPLASNYGSLVNKVNSDNKSGYTDLSVLAKDDSFTCSNISQQIDTFNIATNNAYSALNTYVRASTNLINRGGGL